MSAIKIMIAWVMAGAERFAAAIGREPLEPEPYPKKALREAVAQDQDHTDAQREHPQTAAQSKSKTSAKRGPVSVLRLDVDGSSALTLRARGRDIELRDRVRAAHDRGETSIGLPDRWGEVVTMAIERGRVGGEYVLHTSAVRLAVRRRAAELVITSWAAEGEGVRSWYAREVPRALWWVLGLEIDGDCDEVAAKINEVEHAGKRLVTTRIIHTALDFQGLPLTDRLRGNLVTRSTTFPSYLPGAEHPHSVRISSSANAHSAELYDKPAKLAQGRGPTRQALIESWLGREVDDPEAALAELIEQGGQLLRFEDRRHGRALDLDGLDCRHPGAMLDRELLGRLMADALTKTRLLDAAAANDWRQRHAEWLENDGQGPEPRKRDCPEDSRWTALREAVAGEGSRRIKRIKVKRQHRSVLEFHIDRAVAEVADVDVLLGGGAGERGAAGMARVRAEIEREAVWRAKYGAAQARHAEMMRRLGSHGGLKREQGNASKARRLDAVKRGAITRAGNAQKS